MLTSCTTFNANPNDASKAALERSPQWRDGQFRNTLAAKETSLWQILRKQFNHDSRQTVPTEALPVQFRDRGDFDVAPAGGLRVTWLGHSTTLIEIDGYRVLTDPVWSERASPFRFLGPKRFHAPPLPLDELPSIDAVIISHDHYDHLDRPTIEALRERIPLFAVPLGIGVYLEQWGVDSTRIVELDWWDSHRVGKLELTATPARHFSGRSLTMSNQNQTLWAGWAIAGPEHRVFFSGDTAMFPGFRDIGERLGPFDLTMIETGAYDALWSDVHIGPEQAVEAHRMLRGRLLMPIHWGTFNLAMHNWTEPVERLLVAADRAGVPVVTPRPGESVDARDPLVAWRWWPELQWRTAEDSPIVSSGLAKNNAKVEIPGRILLATD